jgi:hypothetical protein
MVTENFSVLQIFLAKHSDLLGVQQFVTCHSHPYLRRADGMRSLERTGIVRNFLLAKKNPEIKKTKTLERSWTFIIYCLGALASDRAACSHSINDSQEDVREGYHGRIRGCVRHEVLSLSAVKKWRKRVNGGTTLEDDPRSGRRPRSDLCESPRDLIDETRFISCKCMYVRGCGSRDDPPARFG